MLLDPLGEVFEPMPLLWVFPCLPHRSQLNHDVHWREDMLGQREEALEEGSGLGLGPGCHAGDGAFAQQGAHGVGVDAEPKNPCLGAHRRRTGWHPASLKALAMVGGAGARGNSSIHGPGAVESVGGDPVVLVGSSRMPRVVLPVDPGAVLSIRPLAVYGLGCDARCIARRYAWALPGLHIMGMF